MSSDSLPPASSDAKDIATLDDLVFWRGKIVKVIDRGSHTTCCSVAAKFHSSENHQTLGEFKAISDDLAMRMP
jgi:hypothetical protein